MGIGVGIAASATGFHLITDWKNQPADVQFRLIPATPEDRDWLDKLRRLAYHDLFIKTWGAWSDARHQRHFDITWTRENISIIEAGGQRAGMIQLIESPDRIELSEIQILPAIQGQGLGTAVILQVIQHAAQQKKELCLCVGLQNTGAFNLYSRLGFTAYDRSDTHFYMKYNA